jgi:cysteinyl-tRNA synthetase
MHKKGISTSVIRYALLNTHYHKPIEFNDNVLREASENVKYLGRAIGQSVSYNHEELTAEFFNYLLDDLNTHSALNYLLKLAKTANKTLDSKIKESIKYCCNFLGLLSEAKQDEDSEEVEKINLLVAQRDEAKRSKNWLLADKIRDELDQMGISLQDSKDLSTKWERR